MQDIITISDSEFRDIADIVYQKAGINLGEHKKALVIGRLNKVLKQLQLESYKDYRKYLDDDASGTGISLLVDRISTNHTFFFRENNHFDFLIEKILPEISRILEGRQHKEIRIWSAGCSSGEEPYTISMVLDNYFQDRLSQWDVGILATDISTIALDKAKRGTYPRERLEDVSKAFLHKYFSKESSDRYSIRQDYRKDILFRRLNLMNQSFPFKGKFDVIFCRNVMIYFDKKTRNELINKFHHYLKDGGYLLVGHSESLDRGSSPFKYIKPAVYRK